jgi:hypothetical protein
MKQFIKNWFTIGQSDLFGDLLRISFPFALIIWILTKIL